jgi:hypothetical protein
VIRTAIEYHVDGNHRPTDERSWQAMLDLFAETVG